MGERISFNLSNFAQQEFPFSLKLIEYINLESDAEVKQMLDRTCKYFFANAPFLILDTMETSQWKKRIENEQYDGCMDFMENYELERFLEKVKFIWITKKIDVKARYYLDITFPAKIRRCDASEISVLNCQIDLNGLKYLTKSGNVEYLELSFSIFSGLDTSPVPLEDVLSLVPTARVIKMINCHITRQTMKKLLAIPWKNKITELSLRNVDSSLNANWFFTFVKKHLDSEAKIHVNFNFEDNSFKKRYNQKVLESGEKMPMFEIDAPPAHLKMWPEDEPKKITFNDDDAERQYTAFPYPHMCYIRENAEAETWKKFERTCKFYYPRNPYFMVDDFSACSDGKISLMVDEKRYMFENYEEVKKVGKPLWITNSIDISYDSDFDHTYSNRIHASKIFIAHLAIQKNLLISLTKYGLVKDWNSYYSRIVYDNERVISLNELLIHLPNAESIRATVCGINYQNAIESASLPQRNKIKYLKLGFIFQPIHAHQLYDILTEILAPIATVKLDLQEFENEMDVPQFQTDLKAKLDTWKPQIERPTVRIYVALI